MRIFVSGTDTEVGKTLVASWLCLHSGYAYFKPVQTGIEAGTDSETLERFQSVTVYPESYRYPGPFSPHWAASLKGEEIDISRIVLPQSDRLIIEGAGGLLVPLNREKLMIDLIQAMRVPVILVARSGLGTINHTLLSLEALRARRMPVLGVIVNGVPNPPNCDAIAYYGGVPVLATLPWFPRLTRQALGQIPLPDTLSQLLESSHESCDTRS